MRRLFVLYDSQCGLCRSLANWLTAQSALIPLYPIPAQSPDAARLFPGLAASGPPQELTVISDQGAVWTGDHAWIMCLYALRHYRRWAKKLASPLLSPLARQAYATLSKHRSTISWFMADQVLAKRLQQVSPPACGTGSEDRNA